MKTKRTLISAEDFIKAYQSASTIDKAVDVLKKINPKMDNARVRVRAASYIKAGVKLKKFPKSTRKLNVDELNTLAKEHQVA